MTDLQALHLARYILALEKARAELAHLGGVLGRRKAADRDLIRLLNEAGTPGLKVAP